MMFRVMWGLDALVASVPLYFFLVGLTDGSVSSFNILLWAVLLFFLAAILVGSVLLRSHGHRIAAWITLLLLAVPGLLAAMFVLGAIVLRPRWN